MCVDFHPLCIYTVYSPCVSYVPCEDLFMAVVYGEPSSDKIQATFYNV